MRETLQKRCELFVANRDALKKAFRWESPYMYPLCASMYTSKNREVDVARLEECRAIIKENTNVFSNFRGIAHMALVSGLALSPNPEEKWAQTAEVYDQLKELFWGSQYLAVTAAAIVDLTEPGRYGEVVRRTRALYERMKDAHPFLTSGEDSAFAALLAMSDADDFAIEQETERCYSLLRPPFYSGNALQSLSQVLALGSDPAEEKCRRVQHLYEQLRGRGYKYGKSYELATLGALVLMEKDLDALTEDMTAVDDYLQTQKGFGTFGIGAKQRLMYAGLLTVDERIKQVETMQVMALKGALSLVIAQQVAVCAAVVAASAAAASASSSSS